MKFIAQLNYFQTRAHIPFPPYPRIKKKGKKIKNPSCKTFAQSTPIRPKFMWKNMTGRLKELVKKYGKVGMGVHLSVSAASIAGLYVAVKNNVDVESMLEKVGLPNLAKGKDTESSAVPSEDLEMTLDQPVKERNRTAELAASSGGALAVAVLINKALFPVRVPITFALTPPIARFLAKRNLYKTGG